MRIQNLHSAAVALADEQLTKLLPFQVLDKGSRDYGGLYSDALGACSASNGCTPNLIFLGTWGYCSPQSAYFNSEALFERVMLAIDYEMRARRPSGFIDLRERNFDSPPDTAFAIGTIADGAWIARHVEGSARGKELEIAMAPFLRESACAIADHGGFHTPNHRWIIVGALSQVWELYPELNLRPVIDTYLAEGIDQNDAGLYSEKSFIYSAAINDKLLRYYDAFGDASILEKIRRNCHGILDMMNADATLLTNISIRQDNGRKARPEHFLQCFYYVARLFDDQRIWSAIALVLETCGMNDLGMLNLFARHPEWAADVRDVEPLCEDYEKLFRDVGIWKWKQGELSVSAMTGQVGVLSVQYGGIAIPEIRMHAPYFTAQKYTCEALEATPRGVSMRLRPTYGAGQELLMPGYWKPLNRPVPFEDLPYNNLAERTPTPRPNVAYDWTVEKRENGFDLTVKSVDGMTGVPCEVEFLLNLPGTLIQENSYEKLTESRALQLTAGYVTYRVDGDAVTIGPGSYGNTNVDSVIPQDKNMLKLIVSDLLPVEHRFEIRFFRLAGCAPEKYHQVLR